MKKSVISMLLILVALCFLSYSFSDSKAAPSSVQKANSVSAAEPLKKVINIEDGDDEEDEEDEEDNDDEEETEKVTEKADVKKTTESAQNNENTVNVDSTKNTNTNSGNKLFKKSGREAIDEAMNGNDIGIMSDDYELGDETLPEVDTEGFFQHVYNKLWVATTGMQKVLCVISVMFFLASLVMVLVSSLGNRKHLGWYLFSLLISCLVFVGSLYAPQIVAAFSNWFVN